MPSSPQRLQDTLPPQERTVGRNQNYGLIETRQARSSFLIAFCTGISAAFVMSFLSAIARSWNLISLDLELWLGSVITGTFSTRTLVLGTLWHLLNGGVFGLLYAFAFRALRRSSVFLGVCLGIVHWLFGGLLLGILGVIHPFPRSAYITVDNMIGFLVLHMIYGAIVGGAYRNSKEAFSLPMGEEES